MIDVILIAAPLIVPRNLLLFSVTWV